MIIPLQNDLIYGPVNSRRLGHSLGINLLPTEYKICSFNCLYCQYGWTKIHGTQLTEGSWPKVAEILSALEDVLKQLSQKPDYITFSGNGEPTLHPQFPELVEGVTSLRNEYAPGSKTAVLSNSSTINNENVCSVLGKLDERIMKLDCGSPVDFKRYNRPCCGINHDKIVSGLKKINEVTIQALFSRGESGNYNRENLNKWYRDVVSIRPKTVQIYTLDRGYPSGKIAPLEIEKLIEIKNQLNKRKVSAQVYS